MHEAIAKESVYERAPDLDTDRSFGYRLVGRGVALVALNGAYVSKKKTHNEPPARVVVRLEVGE